MHTQTNTHTHTHTYTNMYTAVLTRLSTIIVCVCVRARMRVCLCVHICKLPRSSTIIVLDGRTEPSNIWPLMSSCIAESLGVFKVP